MHGTRHLFNYISHFSHPLSIIISVPLGKKRLPKRLFIDPIFFLSFFTNGCMIDGFRSKDSNQSQNEPNSSYLPGSKDTVISKAVPSGRDSTIALRWSWSLRFPQMWGTREHNLWELGTAFALSPHHYSVIPSLLPHLNIAVSIWNHHFPFSLKSNFGADHNISHWCYFFSLIWTLDPIQC